MVLKDCGIRVPQFPGFCLASQWLAWSHNQCCCLPQLWFKKKNNNVFWTFWCPRMGGDHLSIGRLTNALFQNVWLMSAVWVCWYRSLIMWITCVVWHHRGQVSAGLRGRLAMGDDAGHIGSCGKLRQTREEGPEAVCVALAYLRLSVGF